MVDRSPAQQPWLVFIGLIVLVSALYVARDVLVPVVLAVLITFVLSTPVNWLERRIGRVPAVLGVVLALVAVIGVAGWGLSHQLDDLAADLPRYRVNLSRQLTKLRNVGKGGAVEELTKTIESVQQDLSEDDTPRGRAATRPVVVMSDKVDKAFSWLGSLFGAVTTTGVVLTLVIFMLLERRQLRDRVIRVVGRTHVALTTKALDEAGQRVARQLLMQTLVNVIYGVIAGLGFYVLDVPYPLVWAVLAGLLRFIPYVGPIIGVVAPVIVSVATMDEGWRGPLMVVGFVAVLELFTNLVLETLLYAGAAGVSQVGLLVSVIFWSWLWGPLGLLMAVPLTACLVVMGKHVPCLRFLSTLMAETPPLPTRHGYYQRILAKDTAEAADLIEGHVKSESPRSVYDGLVLPALNFAEMDRLEGRLTADEESSVLDITRELLSEATDQVTRAEASARRGDPTPGLAPPLRVLGYPTNGTSDALALEVFARAVDDLPVTLEVSSRLLASELATWVEREGIAAVCIADLPPSPPFRSRYLIRRLRALSPEVRIMVGRWAPANMADDTAGLLSAAGANHVGTSLEQSRAYLAELVRHASATGSATVAAR